jgi:hypothetical protein
MSNYTAIREMLKRTSGQENTFTVPRVYVDYTGDLTTAILLNQIVFLSDKSKRTDGFFYKTYKEWEKEICLTERQVRYSVNKLKAIGIVETKIMKANGSPTVHYKLDYDKFVESILTFCQIPFEQFVSIDTDILSESLTENTTENTTEKYLIEFETFWKEYPRKIDKKKAFLNFKTAAKKHGHQIIIDGAKNYAKECGIKQTNKTYIKHPTTFLNAESFLNEFELTSINNAKQTVINTPKLFDPKSLLED